MLARIKIERPGTGVTAQDCGRTKYRAIGVPLGGALDPVQLAAANALAGAPEDSAGLEILLAAPTLRIEQGPLRVGLAGALSGVLTRADGGQHTIAGWRGMVLQSGDLLALRLTRGPACLGFSGGLDLPLVLGSRSTFLRAKFGGLDGRALIAGDILRCAAADGKEVAAPAFAHEDGPLRFIPGPQAENFTRDARADFIAAEWRASADSDRMGMRLSGPKLTHRPGGANIVSDGATPGAIQVPGDGQPIVLRADCQTSGGYAKIGCMISADVFRAAHFLAGDAVAFTPVDHRQAAEARRKLHAKFAQWREKISAVSQPWDTEKLWSENLISGASSGD
jgi:5-oxoprolinase (ATP-hydrolysing) subunit C